MHDTAPNPQPTTTFQRKWLVDLTLASLLSLLLVACQPGTPSAAPTPSEPQIAPQPVAVSTELRAQPVTPTENSAITTEVLVEQTLDYPRPTQTYSGICLSHSEIVPSFAAWRCEVARDGSSDKTIADPCLVQPNGTIICNPGSAWRFVLELTVPLPHRDLTTMVPVATPWFVMVAIEHDELADGVHICTLDLTQKITVDGRPARYICDVPAPEEYTEGGRVVILGDVRPGDPWTADLAWVLPDGEGWRIREEQESPLRLVRTFTSPLDTAYAAGITGTEVIDYVPTLPEGEAQEGACWTNALSINNPRAWRCTVNDEIHDPCFEVPGEPDILACNANPLSGNQGFALELSEALPLANATYRGTPSPWLLELADGSQCSLATGATGTIGEKRVEYLCASTEQQEVVLLGSPVQSVVQNALSTDPESSFLWSAERATLAIGDEGIQLLDTAWVPVQRIVRGPQVFVPLDCDGLSRDIAPLIATQTATATSTFTDYAYNQSGSACEVKASGDGTTFGDFQATMTLLRAYFENQGWLEDLAYLGTGPTGEASGFRNRGGLCLVDVSWSLAAGAMCPEDEPLAFCDLAPEEQLYQVSIGCAQDIYGEPVTAGGYALGTATPDRIEFPVGGTETTWTGNVSQGEIERHIFRAMEGQLALIEISAPPDSIGLQIVATPDGTAVQPAEMSSFSWSGVLPTTTDYVFRIAGRETAAYTARLIIPRILSREAGANLSIEGTAPTDTSVHYLLEANKDTVGRIALETAEEQAELSVYGFDDGQDLLSTQKDATLWEGRFPTTQRYLIEITAGENDIAYTLAIETEGGD